MMGGVVGWHWCWAALVLGHPTYLDNSRARAIVLAVGAGHRWDGLDTFSLSYHLFSLSVYERQLDTKILSERAVKPKTTSGFEINSSK